MPVKTAPKQPHVDERRESDTGAKAYREAERLREAVGFDPHAMAAFLGISTKTYTRRAETGTLGDAESLKVEMLERALAHCSVTSTRPACGSTPPSSASTRAGPSITSARSGASNA